MNFSYLYNLFLMLYLFFFISSCAIAPHDPNTKEYENILPPDDIQYGMDQRILDRIPEQSPLGGGGIDEDRGYDIIPTRIKIPKLSSPRSVAIVIGINNYKNERKLKYAVNDAKAIKRCLQEKTNYKIYNELYDRQATKKKISNAIDQLVKDSSIDRVIIYFAGHGIIKPIPFKKSDTGFLLPYDYEPQNNIATSISMNEVETWSNSLQAKQVLFIFDACYSGLIGSGNSRGNSRIADMKHYYDMLAKNPGRHVMTASTRHQEAKEINELGHGVFTYFLVKGIKGEADFNSDNVLTLNEIEYYLMPKVAEYTEGKQTPQLVEFFGGSSGQLLIELKK